MKALLFALAIAMISTAAMVPRDGDACNTHVLYGVTSLTPVQDYWLITSHDTVDLASKQTVWVRFSPSLQFAISDCRPGGAGWGHMPEANAGPATVGVEQPIVLENEWTHGKQTVRVRTNCLGLGTRACIAKHKKAVELMALTFPPS